MKFAKVEMSNSDVMEINYNGINPTKDQFEAYLKEVIDMVEQNPGAAQLYDGTNIKLLPADLRIRHGKWIKENEGILSQNVTVTAIIIPNMLARMVMRGIFLI
ncbi:MAG TPA: hypothetical protein DCE41_04810 [Cytophagales bacterium]|nr:hypothetical protein [Cytophagales bacterium]HAA22502.1 hypothetical protein [Cytophagales bacterium]HAP62155.1 hypothetical protein [Cytophagales bacterium]